MNLRADGLRVASETVDLSESYFFGYFGEVDGTTDT
jgi:hypothetical protein